MAAGVGIDAGIDVGMAVAACAGIEVGAWTVTGLGVVHPAKMMIVAAMAMMEPHFIIVPLSMMWSEKIILYGLKQTPNRFILADPGILILDEVTSSVDTRVEARIHKSLLRLMQGRTSFVIAHRLSTIRAADQVVVIDHGETVERGTHQELLDRCGFYHHLYVSQFKGEAI